MINGYKTPLSHEQIVARIQCFYDFLNYLPYEDVKIADLIDVFFNTFEEIIYDISTQDEMTPNE